MTTYHKALQKALNGAAKSSRPEHITADYCREAIAGIAEQLKGPCEAERILLLADRAEFRKWLAELEAVEEKLP